MSRCAWPAAFGTLIPLLLWACPAKAGILYTYEHLGGSQYRFDYTITNSTSTSLEAFTIFFDPSGDQSGLTNASTITGWDIFVDDPVPPLLDGLFDAAIATASPLGPGGIISGFAVTFDYTGPGLPGAQEYQLYAGAYELIEAGTTVWVPEPATLLLLTGCLGVLVVRRRPGREANSRL